MQNFAFSAWLLYVTLRWNKRQRGIKGNGLVLPEFFRAFFFLKVFPIVYFGLLFQSNTRGFLFKGHHDPPSSLQPLQFFWFHCEALCWGACKVQMPSAKTFEEQHWLRISLYSCIQEYSNVFLNYSFFLFWGSPLLPSRGNPAPVHDSGLPDRHDRTPSKMACSSENRKRRWLDFIRNFVQDFRVPDCGITKIVFDKAQIWKKKCFLHNYFYKKHSNVWT